MYGLDPVKVRSPASSHRLEAGSDKGPSQLGQVLRQGHSRSNRPISGTLLSFPSSTGDRTGTDPGFPVTVLGSCLPDAQTAAFNQECAGRDGSASREGSASSHAQTAAFSQECVGRDGSAGREGREDSASREGSASSQECAGSQECTVFPKPACLSLRQRFEPFKRWRILVQTVQTRKYLFDGLQAGL